MGPRRLPVEHLRENLPAHLPPAEILHHEEPGPGGFGSALCFSVGLFAAVLHSAGWYGPQYEDPGWPQTLAEFSLGRLHHCVDSLDTRAACKLQPRADSMACALYQCHRSGVDGLP